MSGAAGRPTGFASAAKKTLRFFLRWETGSLGGYALGGTMADSFIHHRLILPAVRHARIIAVMTPVASGLNSRA
jgi:hypothetical protein